ncbi:MAG: ATP-binding protein, partial [Clostridia bacterium]
QLLYQVSIMFDSYNRVIDDAIRALEKGDLREAQMIIKKEVLPKRAVLLNSTKELKDYLENMMDDTLDDNIRAFTSAIEMLTGLVIFTALIGTFITIWILRSITSSLNKVTSVITKGNYGLQSSLPRIEVTSNDEIGKIAAAFNEIAVSLEEHSKHEKEYKDMLQEQNWLKTKIAEFSSMYQGVHDLQALAHLFITKITPLISAGFGVFYLREGNGEEQRYSRIAAYAAMEYQMGKRSFLIGEGLVGQAALEKRMIQVADIPRDYIHITSGLGKGLPACLLLVPVEFEGEVLAVVELAGFATFEPIHLKLLDQVVGNLGITINSVDVYMKLEKLLKDSQHMTEELQIQSGELQQQQEELRSINEQLELQYQHSEQKSRELEKVKIALEEKAQQVLISSQYKSEFLANMSHELRTPLNSMLILAHILAENREGNLNLSQVEYANTIMASGNDLLRLINEVLDLSKVESGKMELFSSDVILDNVQTYLERQFVPVADQKGLDFSIFLDERLPRTIFTDEHRLQQILRNLLSNAFKFTEKGSVMLSFTLDTDDRENPMISIRVIDTGIGIPQEKHELIFEAFRQADGTTSRKYGGTGLGLNISKEMAHLLGGSIQVESEIGRGSTFTLLLPLHHGQMTGGTAVDDVQAEVAAGEYLPEYPCAKIDGATKLSNKKVLIIDDDVRNVFALVTALEGCQMKVLFAEDAHEGVQSLKQMTDIDIVLIDLLLAQRDHLQAIREIRQNETLQATPIIALASKATDDERRECLAAGVTALLGKPIKLEELMPLVMEYLLGEEQLR